MPDLNPIEYAWAKLKERIYQLDPAIKSFYGTENEHYDCFRYPIERSWEDLGQDYLDGLIYVHGRGFGGKRQVHTLPVCINHELISQWEDSFILPVLQEEVVHVDLLMYHAIIVPTVASLKVG